ncbi:MAG TPA: SLC13 family permease, partial [Anaerolineales bacterium]|nr:SLC13 family permease [Anaerolineales bacterium]
MTVEIGLTLGILGIAVYLFISEKLRMDAVALLVLVSLALLGLVTPAEALSGFSNPAVVTVWAVFILSGALSRTGVANVVGKQIIRFAGSNELRLIAMIMVTTAVLSAFMNNVGITALFLPVVVSISRRTGLHPSRLLLPLAVSSMLGGMMTLIGTAPNILASNALRDAGFQPLRLFDFLPVGGAVTLAGILFMLVIGRRLLPRSGPGEEGDDRSPAQIDKAYLMSERVSHIRIPADSPLSGRTLSDTRLSAALGLTVLDVHRAGDRHIIPSPGTQLKEGDLLTVSGRLDTLEEVRGRQYLTIESEGFSTADLVNETISLVGLGVPPGSAVIDKTLRQLDFRRAFGVIVLALLREGRTFRTGFDQISLNEGDILLAQGTVENCNAIRGHKEFELVEAQDLPDFKLEERLLKVRIPADSPLVGKSLAESHLAEMAGL